MNELYIPPIPTVELVGNELSLSEDFFEAYRQYERLEKFFKSKKEELRERLAESMESASIKKFSDNEGNYITYTPETTSKSLDTVAVKEYLKQNGILDEFMTESSRKATVKIGKQEHKFKISELEEVKKIDEIEMPF